jgi:hypothetical protein
VAVTAQLSAHATGLTSLLTLACPVRRLYGRAFPAYYGPGQLDLLQERLASVEASGKVHRWRNVNRDSDCVGGYALRDSGLNDSGLPHETTVDQHIFDPAALRPNNSPLTVTIHEHSDWFIDEQTYAHTSWLIDRLAGPLADAHDSPNL